MKKGFAWVIALLMVFSLSPSVNQAGAAGTYAFTGSDHGNLVNYARIGDWTVRDGVMDNEPIIVGAPDGGEEQMLTGCDLPGIVPCGDSFVFYGTDKSRKNKWMIMKPGEAAKPLPISIYDDVIWGDADVIWYAHAGSGRDSTVYSVDHKGKNKKTVTKVTGTILGVMNDGGVLAADWRADTLNTWKNGKATTVYATDSDSAGPLTNAVTDGSTIWAVATSCFGPVKDGKLAFEIPGFLTTTAMSDGQIVALVPFEIGAEESTVYLLDGNSERYAVLGYYPSYGMTNITLEDGAVTVWTEPTDAYPNPVQQTFPIDESTEFTTYEQAINQEGDPGDPNEGADVQVENTAEAMLETTSTGPETDDEWKTFLRGSWHADTSVGSGYAERYVFTDKYCVNIPSQQDGESDQAALATWGYSLGMLMLTTDESVTLHGVSWVNATDTTMYAIDIDGQTFYKVSDDPAYFPDLSDYGVDVSGEDVTLTTQGDNNAANLSTAPTDQEWAGMLYGTWIASEPMGRGYGRRAIFSEGSVILLPGDEEADGIAIQASWDVLNGVLELYHGKGEANLAELPLTLVVEGDGDTALTEAYIGDTLMNKYMDTPDPEIDLTGYDIQSDGADAGPWAVSTAVGAYSRYHPIAFDGFLLGGSSEGQWIAPDQMEGYLNAVEAFKVYADGGYVCEATGSLQKNEPPEVDKMVIAPATAVDASAYLALAADWDIAPRAAAALDPNDADCVAAIRAVLDMWDLPDAPVKIMQAYQIDLDGDGVDERVIYAQNIVEATPQDWQNGIYQLPGILEPVHKADTYSILLVQKQVFGETKDIFIDKQIYTDQGTFEDGPPSLYYIVRFADLNGDGGMEILAGDLYYEGLGYGVYQVEDDGAFAVLYNGYGA